MERQDNGPGGARRHRSAGMVHDVEAETFRTRGQPRAFGGDAGRPRLAGDRGDLQAVCVRDGRMRSPESLVREQRQLEIDGVDVVEAFEEAADILLGPAHIAGHEPQKVHSYAEWLHRREPAATPRYTSTMRSAHLAQVISAARARPVRVSSSARASSLVTRDNAFAISSG